MPDAITLNPMLGFDTLDPFVKAARDTGKGLFVLVRTSNPGSAQVQDVQLADGRSWSEMVADGVAVIAEDPALLGTSGFSSIGAVVGRDAVGDDGEPEKANAQVDFSIAGIRRSRRNGGDDSGGIRRWQRRNRVREPEHFICSSRYEICRAEDELGKLR